MAMLGIVPSELSQLSKLELLRLDRNSLTGDPFDFSRLHYVYAGNIPAGLSQLSCLRELNLSSNELSGKYDAI